MHNVPTTRIETLNTKKIWPGAWCPSRLASRGHPPRRRGGPAATLGRDEYHAPDDKFQHEARKEHRAFTVSLIKATYLRAQPLASAQLVMAGIDPQQQTLAIPIKNLKINYSWGMMFITPGLAWPATSAPRGANSYTRAWWASRPDHANPPAALCDSSDSHPLYNPLAPLLPIDWIDLAYLGKIDCLIFCWGRFSLSGYDFQLMPVRVRNAQVETFMNKLRVRDVKVAWWRPGWCTPPPRTRKP